MVAFIREGFGVILGTVRSHDWTNITNFVFQHTLDSGSNTGIIIYSYDLIIYNKDRSSYTESTISTLIHLLPISLISFFLCPINPDANIYTQFFLYPFFFELQIEIFRLVYLRYTLGFAFTAEGALKSTGGVSFTGFPNLSVNSKSNIAKKNARIIFCSSFANLMPTKKNNSMLAKLL
jgi:hypothetical protein